MESAIQSIESAAADRLVFLVGLEEGEVGFEVRSLQEFMAGEALLEANDTLAERRLRTVAGNDTWLNVFLFAAGKCFKERQYFRSTLVQICNDINDDPADRASQLTLQGSRLALNVLQEGSARRSPLYASQLTRIALRLIASPVGSGYATQLADASSVDTLDIYREVLEPLHKRDTDDPVTVPAWACWTRLADSGLISVDEWKSRIDSNPSLLLDQSCFWRAVGASQANSELVDVLAASLHRHSPFEIREALQANIDGQQEMPIFTDGSASWHPALSSLMPFLMESRENARRVRLSVSMDLPSYAISIEHRPAVPYSPVHITEDMHPGWNLVATARDYAYDPSAEHRRLIALAADEWPTSTSWISNRLSWPAAACFGFASSASELASLARKIQGGELGNLADWKRSEEAWISKGFTLGELLADAPVELPFSANSAAWAPLLASSGIVGNDGRTPGSMTRKHSPKY